MFKILLQLTFILCLGIISLQSASMEYDEEDDYFTCKNGYTIPDHQVCNGHRDCSDGTDEFEEDNVMLSQCLKADCPHFDAKCYYGACIPHKSWCNGINDCADKSDEWKYFCRKSENPDELSCESGEFISSNLFCDGKPDCSDASDESRALCSLRKCGETQFRCRYGGCIDARGKCNGKNDCHDGSDEDEYHAGCKPKMATISNRTLTPTIIRGCIIQFDENHDIRNENENVHIESGYWVPIDTRIAIKCKSNFSLWANTDEVVRLCEPSGWDRDIPRCYKFCDAKILKRSSSTVVSCKYQTTPVECERIRPNMIAEVSCADSYKMPSKISRDPTISMRCTDKFAWNRRKINCEPICGKTERISDATASESPWHVGIYALSLEDCGGTIISPRLVITALHCVLDENEDVLSPSAIQVIAAGDLRNGVIESITNNVSKIYADRSNNGDVALLQLSIPFILSKNIRPSCIAFSSPDITTDQLGFVHGWYRHKRRLEESMLFKKTKIRTISRSDCASDLRDDQFCVRPSDRMIKDTYRTGQLCQGDSGGGIIVHRDYKYYLIGIVSYKPSHGLICTMEPVVVTDFTKIPEMLKNVIERDVESLYEE